MAVEVKKSDALELEGRILAICANHVNGVSDKTVQEQEPDIQPQQRIAAINRLLTMGKIEVLKGSSGLVYRLKTASAISQLKGVDNQEKLVFQVIESVGNKGIWIRDIRRKCNLMAAEVTKIVKNLESKKLIKAVQSVSASKRKVYMLYNLEPDISITGGAWYSGQNFDSEFVELLNQQCFKFLEQKSNTASTPSLQQSAAYATAEDILEFISKLGISKVQLSTQDIEAILNTLIYDGKIKTIFIATKDGSKKLFKSIKPLIEHSNFTRIPCGVCPVFKDCHPGGEVSPEKCIYINEWLDPLEF